MGKIESHNPFFGLWLPQWFLTKHPLIKNHLNVNQDRLSSYFDAHQTLLDILHADFGGNFSNIKKNSKSRGMSMLKELPMDRSCREAGIPDTFCACEKWTAVDSLQETWLLDGAQFVVQHLNDLMNMRNFGIWQRFQYTCDLSISPKARLYDLLNHFNRNSVSQTWQICDQKANRFLKYQISNIMLFTIFT